MKIKAFSFCEYFAGDGACSRAIRAANYPVASLDILYWEPRPDKQNYMDIMTAAGMAFLLLTI